MRLVVALVALSLASACDRQSQAPSQAKDPDTAASDRAKRPTAGFIVSPPGRTLPDVALQTISGQPTTLKAAVRGPALVNLWASWCAPCVAELPSLATLAQRLDGRLTVIPISQDSVPAAQTAKWWADHKLAPMQTLLDPEGRLLAVYEAVSLPTTIAYDAQGREVWRLVGDVDWGSAKAEAMVKPLLVP